MILSTRHSLESLDLFLYVLPEFVEVLLNLKVGSATAYDLTIFFVLSSLSPLMRTYRKSSFMARIWLAHIANT